MGNDNGNKRRRPKERRDRWFNSRTLVLMAVCGIVAFGILVGRLYYLQIVRHEDYQEQAASQQSKYVQEYAQRGGIYYRNGNALAISSSAENVFISPYELVEYKEDASKISTALAEILDMDYEEIMARFKRTDSWYEVLKKKVDEDTADKIRELIENGEEPSLKSVHLEETSRRSYPYGSLACHVIGFVGSENRGLEGTEAMYDRYLTGTAGRTVSLVNGWGMEMLSSAFESYYDVQNGENVTLTIDVTVQSIVEEYLEQAIEINDVLNGAACIAMDPHTGEILAMASYGTYDPNDYQTLAPSVQKDIDRIEDEEKKSAAVTEALFRQWRNKALSDTYEPGSVFKTITLSMALEEGLVTEQDAFYCGGSINVTGREQPILCWLHSGHGMQTLAQATQNSCNCAFVTIGAQVGADRFYEYVEAFGLFDETGIDLSGEGSSIWWSDDVFKDPTNKSQLAAASFGQTFTVTPIQMITAISACCNGGYLMQPYVVSSVSDSEGNTVLLNEPTVRRQVISEETSATVNKILETVVTDGGGSNAYVPGYHIAGKTGTSEKVTENLTADYREYVVSFCGYAPASDPKVVVLLLLDTPSHRTGRYISGANMAAPVVGKIIAGVLDYMGYEPDYSDGEQALADVVVPNLSGWGQNDAIAALSYQDLDYELVGSGSTVTAQYPEAWSVIATGSRVILYLGEEPETGEVTVPNISGLSYVEALKRLQGAGLFISKSSGLSGPGMTVGTQYTEAGEKVPFGSVIEVALVDEARQGEY